LQNCIDRHLAKRGEKTAIVLNQMTLRKAALHITYNELHQRVKWQTYCVNKAKKGDRVCIYLPMIPELAVSILACARILHTFSCFAGFFQPRQLQVELMTVHAKWLSPMVAFAAIKPLI
jgi:acetyl-CoA synthetase